MGLPNPNVARLSHIYTPTFSSSSSLSSSFPSRFLLGICLVSVILIGSLLLLLESCRSWSPVVCCIDLRTWYPACLTPWRLCSHGPDFEGRNVSPGNVWLGVSRGISSLHFVRICGIVQKLIRYMFLFSAEQILIRLFMTIDFIPICRFSRTWVFSSQLIVTVLSGCGCSRILDVTLTVRAQVR